MTDVVTGSMAFRFRATPDSVRQVLRIVQRTCAAHLAAGQGDAVQLVLAEVLNNIVEHAYAGDGCGVVQLKLERSGPVLRVTVRDHGCTMTAGLPPVGQMPVVARHTQDLREGGWGWPLIRRLATNVAYERQGPLNLLSLDIPLGPARRGTSG